MQQQLCKRRYLASVNVFREGYKWLWNMEASNCYKNYTTKILKCTQCMRHVPADLLAKNLGRMHKNIKCFRELVVLSAAED